MEHTEPDYYVYHNAWWQLTILSPRMDYFGDFYKAMPIGYTLNIPCNAYRLSQLIMSRVYDRIILTQDVLYFKHRQCFLN
jgi:hypothetical protein